MMKLLVVAVLVALLALSAEGFRVTRQVEEEEGTLTKITDKVKSLYQDTVSTASGYLESIRGMKLEEKAKNIYLDTSMVVSTYANIAHDQLYHFFYAQK
ncbi:apolipoprotein C-II [Hippoglossus stenolepis]|uniref:apolipoprotein C-II n=1 Tax=Hippoglossus stenolepis TaxID=195615 RepID=UPI00159C112F|nr:apolipoprotein C-II [Hippoglossus stenolepis]XP_035019960.1 apolipoprotein C-II [Hippoglossus stenolepis]